MDIIIHKGSLRKEISHLIKQQKALVDKFNDSLRRDAVDTNRNGEEKSRGRRLLGKITFDCPPRSIPSRYTHALFLGASVPAENFKAAFAADLAVMIVQCLREKAGNLFLPLFLSVRRRSLSEGQTSHLMECNVQRLQK